MTKSRSRFALFAVLALAACTGQIPPPRAHADPAAHPADPPLTALSFTRVAANTDALLEGKTPSPASQNFFKTYDNAAHAYQRNPDCIAAGVDLSCLSVANSANADGTGGNRGCVTLVTPLHGVTNRHFTQPYQNGVVHYFVDRANTVYPRKVVNSAPVGTTDIEVVTFDSPLPASVTPARLLPTGVAARLLLAGTPLLSTNQQKQAIITELAAASGGDIAVQSAVSPVRRAWTASPPAVIGDSDSPTFVLIDRRPYLLFTYFTNFSGPAPAENLSAIRSLLGKGYSLDVATVR